MFFKIYRLACEVDIFFCFCFNLYGLYHYPAGFDALVGLIPKALHII